MASNDNRPGGDTGSHNGEDAGQAGDGRAFSDTAQQVWLAGLGALAKAQEEGGKLFEALVRQGAESQRRAQEAAGQAQSAAQAGASEAAARFAGFASEVGSRAAGQWDKVEEVFDARLQRSLDRLNVPTAQDLAALEARIAALEAQLRTSRSGST